MVKTTLHIILIMALFFQASLSLADETFNVSVNSTTIQLGKPAWVSITSTHTDISLDRINFSHLVQDFEVVKDNNAISTNKAMQSWKIRLYPRNTGRYTIPPIEFMSYRSKAIDVHVTDPVDNKTGQQFKVISQLSTDKPWQRQQALFLYEILTRSEKFILEPQAMDLNRGILLPLSTSTEPLDNSYRHQSGWAMFINKPGNVDIKLPALNLIRDGVITHRFYPPHLKLSVKPLPAYLPGNIPVGKLSFQLLSRPAFVLNNRLSGLAVELNGTGIPVQWLPSLQHLFSSTYQLNIYPVESSKQQTKNSTISSHYRWRMPFKTTRQGIIDIPGTMIHYFDPHTGKLARLEIKIPGLLSLSLWLVIPLAIIFTGIAAWLIIKLHKWWLPRWNCFIAYRTAIKQLDSLQNPHDIRSLVQRLGQAEGWTGNLTQRQWQNNFPVHIKKYAEQLNQQLEVSLYKTGSCNMSDIRHLVRELCLLRLKSPHHIYIFDKAA